MGREKFLGRIGVPLQSIGHSTIVCAKTAEPIGMPFGLWVRMGRRNHVLDPHPTHDSYGPSEPIGAEGRCHGNQFWDAFAVTGFGV